MERDEAITRLKSLKPVFERHGVVAVALFGSTARGQARDDSDIDVLVDYARTPSLLRLGALRAELEDSLGQRVDLGVRGAIRSEIKDLVFADLIDVV